MKKHRTGSGFVKNVTVETVMFGKTKYKLVKDENGKERLIEDVDATLAKLDVSTRLKKLHSKKIRVTKPLKGS